MRRPASLAEVAQWTKNRREFSFHLADFLDEFYLHPGADRLSEEPSRLKDRIDEGAVADAYLAATAVFLARSIGAAPPAWAWDETRKLRSPWFASRGAAIRATLLVESPAPFRERNLFVSANALTRA